MRILLAIFLMAHGFAHLVGFVVPWRIMNSPDLPYRTTVLQGALNLGDAGIRAYGLAWLVAGAAFAAAAAGVYFETPWWFRLMIVAAVASSLLCIADWPETQIGMAVNMTVLALVPLLTWFGLVGEVNPLK